MPSSAQLESTLASAGASGTWDWAVPTDRLYVDARFAELYGIDAATAEDGVATSCFFKAIHPEDRPRIQIATAGMLAGAELFSKEFRIITPDGVTLWMHGRGRSHQDDKDETIRFTGVLVDVTERKRTEERLRIAQTAGGVGTFEYIDGYATATVSDEFCRLLGLHPTSSLPVQTINRVARPGQPQLIPGSPDGVVPETLDAILRIVRNDNGADRWIARRGEIYRDGAGYRLIGVIYDVTAAQEQEAALRELNDNLEARVQQELAIRHRAEDALRQAQKMEAIGQLTGGIAHDFNNLLMAISSSLALLRKRIPDEPNAHRIIDNALQATDRGAALTQRMLAFARRQDLKPEPVHIPALVLGMRELIHHTLGPAWTVQFDFPDGLPVVMADANQIEMAVLNLTVNARDAMFQGGIIEICAQQETVFDYHAEGLAPGDYLRLSVVDHGTGMDAATLARATEPFFTTKGVGKGTGLGLSMIHGLAKQLNGTFTLTSSEGEGTTAALWLPASREQAIVAEVTPLQVDGKSLSRLKIIAVDDDALILMNTADLLGDLGHEVLEASSGEMALRYLEEHSDIDLLITDQAMPNMTGTQLAEHVYRTHPELAIVLATGYGEIPSGAQNIFVKLSKPFTQEDLERAVSMALRPN